MPVSSRASATPVSCHRALVREFGREVDAAARQAHLLAELAAQLVLGGDRRHPRAVARELRHDRARAEQFGAGHDHGLARGGIEIEVAGDPVHGGRAARGDRHVVRAREARDVAVGDGAEAILHEPRDVGHDAIAHALLEVGGIAPVDTHDDDRTRRPAITHAVELNAGSIHLDPSRVMACCSGARIGSSGGGVYLIQIHPRYRTAERPRTSARARSPVVDPLTEVEVVQRHHVPVFDAGPRARRESGSASPATTIPLFNRTHPRCRADRLTPAAAAGSMARSWRRSRPATA